MRYKEGDIVLLDFSQYGNAQQELAYIFKDVGHHTYEYYRLDMTHTKVRLNDANSQGVFFCWDSVMMTKVGDY